MFPGLRLAPFVAAPGQVAPFVPARDYYSMAHSADQLYSQHHGDVLKLHQLSRAELRAKRRAEWKQAQLTNPNNVQQPQAQAGTNRQSGE